MSSAPHFQSRKIHGRLFEVSVNDKKQYFFVLKASNAQIVLRSEQYESKAGALGGVASVQVNSPQPDRYQFATASDGRFYFNLRVVNNQVIGTSQISMSEGARFSNSASALPPAAEIQKYSGVAPVTERSGNKCWIH